MSRAPLCLTLTTPWDGERVLLVRATDAVRMCREDGFEVLPAHSASRFIERSQLANVPSLRLFIGQSKLLGFPLQDLDNATLGILLRAKLRSGDLVVVREGEDASTGDDDSEVKQRRLVREIEAKSRRRLNHAGRSYRLVVGSSLGRLSDRDSYEVVGQRDAVAVVRALAAESGPGGPALAKLLSEAAGMLTKDWRPPFGPDGLVLLRRMIVQQAVEAAAEQALTPSQLKTLGQSDWIEVELVDQDGEPCAMPYRIELPSGEVRTGAFDEDGFFGVHGIETGTCKLGLVATGSGGSAADEAPETPAPAAASAPTPDDNPPAPAEEAQTPPTPDAPVLPTDEATSSFDVTVVDMNGTPITGVEVVFSIENEFLSATTDESGRAHVDGPAGASASAHFQDSDSVRRKLHEQAADRSAGGAPPSGPDVVNMTMAKELPPFSVAADKSRTLVLQPFVAHVRLIGMFFDHGKSFLLPSAMKGIRKLKGLYDEHPGATVIITGHTDTKHSGQEQEAEQYNLTLSDDRAKAVLAFMADDVEAWYAWYERPASSEKHWSTPEDKYLLGALPADADQKYLRAGTSFDQAVRTFQAGHNLTVDGDPGPKTRRALIKDYMNQDGTTLPADVDAKTYACGWYFLDVATGPNADEPRNRRVEIFLFDGPVAPPYPGPQASQGSPEYPAWKNLVTETHDFSTEEQPDDADCHVFYELHAYDTDEAMAGQSYTLTASGQTRSGQTDAQGVLHELSLDPDDYLLEVAGVRMYINAFSSQEPQRRLTVLADPT
jgi:outer membrane protein OmpA-like peptidoglycan-associated protein